MKSKRKLLALAAGLTTIAASAGLALATIPDAAGVIHACYRHHGDVRIVNAAADCHGNETALQWSQTGPQGPQGIQGAQGVQGPAGPPAPVANRTVWISPLAFQAGQFGSSLTFDRGSNGDTLSIGSSSVGDLQWVNAPLSLPSDLKIKKVTVCYQNSSASSFISQVRLAKETLPPSAVVILDDGTDLTSTVPVCVDSAAPFVPTVDGAITLSLRMNFASTADKVDVGAVGIELGP